jgi:hypothetical protein
MRHRNLVGVWMYETCSAPGRTRTPFANEDVDEITRSNDDKSSAVNADGYNGSSARNDLRANALQPRGADVHAVERAGENDWVVERGVHRRRRVERAHREQYPFGAAELREIVVDECDAHAPLGYCCVDVCGSTMPRISPVR